MYRTPNIIRSTVINNSNVSLSDIPNSEALLVDNIGNNSKDGVIVIKK